MGESLRGPRVLRPARTRPEAQRRRRLQERAPKQLGHGTADPIERFEACDSPVVTAPRKQVIDLFVGPAASSSRPFCPTLPDLVARSETFPT